MEDRNSCIGTGQARDRSVFIECINVIVIAIVVFMIAKKVMGEEKVEKK